MLRRVRCILAIVVSILLVETSRAADAISANQARELSPAVAKVLLQRAMTTALLHECGLHFPRLQPAAERANTHWLQANQAVLHKADSLRQRLAQSLQQQQSRIAAEKFAQDIDQAVAQSVQHLTQSLAAYPPPQQRKVCNHLILAVNAGEWDVQHKQAEAFSIVQNYH